ncbi:hypothetical protein PTKIN_Ptkin10aG0199600 [Pterospermum kingtungense]
MEPIMSAKTAKETLAAFQDMEASLDDTDLGLASLKVASQLHQEGNDPEQALSFAHKALKALDLDGKPSIPVSLALHLIGCVNLNFERFDDSLEYLNRAERLLALGRIDEALDSGKKALEVKEMTLEMDRMELGEEYRNLANAFLHVSTFKEALPLGLKALEIHKKELGDDSVEVAHDRMLLGAIYSSAGEYGKALDQFEFTEGF